MPYRVRLLMLASALALCGLVVAGCTRDPETAKRQHFERGNAYLAEKQYRRAIIEFQNALRFDQRYGEARLRLAEALVLSGDSARAVREFVRAADLQPESNEAQLKAGNALLVAGRFADAAGRADVLLKREPKHAAALLLKGHALAGLQQIDEAIEQIEEAIALDAGIDARRSLGILQLQRGQAQAAENTFKEAVQAAPDSPAAHLALGQFYWMTDRIAEAEPVLQRGIELQPTDVEANRAMAAFYVSIGRPREAESYLKAAVQHSSDPAVAMLLGDYYVNMGRREDALAILRPLAAKPGRIGIAAALRTAEIDYGLGQRDQARKTVDDVVAKHPRSAEAQVMKARVLMADGELQPALTHAQKALELDRNSAGAHYTIGQVYLAMQNVSAAAEAFKEVLKINPRAANAHARIAAIQLAEGNATTALSLVEAARATAPTREAQLLLVQSLVATGDTKRAHQEAQLLVDMMPEWAPAHGTFAFVQLSTGDFMAAEKGYRRALELDAADADAQRGLVTVMVRTNRIAEARRFLTDKLAQQPKSVSLLLLLGDLDMHERDVAAAERHYLQAIEAEPDQMIAYDRLGRLYAREQRLADARQKFEELAKRQPRNVVAHTMAAFLLQAENRAADARARYEQVLHIDPRAAVAANNLAWMYAEEGTKLDVALQLAQTAKQEMPNNAGVSDTLGWVFYKRKLYTQAIGAFEEAVKLDPNTAVFHYHLGLAYLEAGQLPKARASLNRALQLPGLAEKDEARQALASIGEH